MTDRGVVFDLGYVPYEGERRSRRGAITTTYQDGVRRVLGIRRRARKKILPWLFVAIAVLPAIVFVGFAFLLSTLSPEADSPFGGHAEYFGIAAGAALMFVGLAAPELLIPDRREGVLSVYSSRPLRSDDYVAARAASLLTVIAGFLLIPQALLYIGFAALSPDGFFEGLAANIDEIPKVLASAVVYALAFAPLALLIATIASRKAMAIGVYIGVMIAATPLAMGLVEATAVPGSRYAALLAIDQHPEFVNDWIFGRVSSTELIVARSGLDPWTSLLLIVVGAVVCAGVVVWRYRRLM